MSQYKLFVRKSLYMLFGVILTSGCAATIEGIKSDFEKVGQKSGLTGSKATGAPKEDGPSETQQRISGIQGKLKELGYYSGDIDGEFSAPTEAAIQDFQLDNDLRINGRPTEELLKVLEAL